MSRAEEFIKKQSHIIENPTSVWISSYNARKAVEIAKEEMIEKVCEYLEPKIWAMNMGDQKFTDECIEDLKQAMKDE